MQLMSGVMCVALLAGGLPQPVRAQNGNPAPAARPAAATQNYSNEQLDALLAPVALYPDQLLTQILMASAYADEVKAADAWVKDPAHKDLTGDALDQALAAEDWDPAVKSLVPFAQVLGQMSDNEDWTGQLGYAVAVQQSDVMASVQRLRQQAQAAGQLQSNAELSVSTVGAAIVIAPAQPDVVYVPVYNPLVAYGDWPYTDDPPVYYPPPPAYGMGNVLLRGMAFGTGVAITARLWGWANPDWGHGNVTVNVGRYNNINVKRAQIHNGNWQADRPNGGWRPPSKGPVGTPRPQHGIPANDFGRLSVSVPGNIARPPAGVGPGSQAGTAGNGPGARPALGNRAGGPGAFNGMGDGKVASQFGSRGAQSQHLSSGAGLGGSRAGGGHK
jgi:Protein of unknown function (DUF3300)